jgi:SAM-dependent methyltransferase
MSPRSYLVGQFARPHGVAGRLAGWIMAHRPSNRQRNLWTVRLLAVQPADRILEIGCGPGVALAACARLLASGRAVGVDHSPTALAQAQRRNRRAIADGRIELRLGGLDALPQPDQPFDKVFLVNVVQFLPDPAQALRALARITTAGGLVAVTYQPRQKNPTRADALAMAERTRKAMQAAGLADLRIEELPLRLVPAVCVLGRRRSEGATPPAQWASAQVGPAPVSTVSGTVSRAAASISPTTTARVASSSGSGTSSTNSS